MRKISIFLVLGFLATNCVILNPVGLNVDRQKGDKVAERIIDAAITADIVFSATRITAGADSGILGISLLSLVADDIAGIDHDRYYIKSEVDDCVNEIRGFTGYLLGSLITNIIACDDLRNDGDLLGAPFPDL